MRKYLIAVILALSLVVLFAPVASAAGINIIDRTGDGIWVGNNWQVELYPSETRTTVISFYNSSNYSLDVYVSVDPETQDDGNIAFGISDDTFTMSGKSYKDVNLMVSATGGATPGAYSTEFELKFEKEPSGGSGGVTSLRITDLEVDDITKTEATITFKTNRSAKTRITYWNGGKYIERDNTYRTKHTIDLDDLDSCTEYEFEIYCVDRYGENDEEDGDFKTKCQKTTPTPIPTPTPTPTPVHPTTEPPTTPPATAPPVTTPPATPETPASEFDWKLFTVIGAGVVLAIIIIAVWYRIHYQPRRRNGNG